MTATASQGFVIPKNLANRYAHIDALRALAVLLVLLQHAGVPHITGDAGVTIFFTISGFIITNVLIRERELTGGFSVRRFYSRRLLKLMPPFALVIAIPTLIYSFFVHIDWGAFLAQVFFSFNWVLVANPESQNHVLPGSVVVWSLAVEEQFYIAFAIVWLLLARASWWRPATATLAIAAILLSTGARLLNDDALRITYGTDTRLDAIGWGVLAALLYSYYRDGRMRWLARFGNSAVLFAAIALFVISFVWNNNRYEETFRYSVHALVAAGLILYGMMSTNTPVHRAFYRLSNIRLIAVIGLASYSIYLIHFVVIKAMSTNIDSALLSNPASLVAVSTLLGVAVYYAVEVPALRLKHRLNI